MIKTLTTLAAVSSLALLGACGDSSVTDAANSATEAAGNAAMAAGDAAGNAAMAAGDAAGNAAMAAGDLAMGGPRDFTAVAEALGVTPEAMQTAMREAGGPPPDLAKAAASLGIDQDTLREALVAGGIGGGMGGMAPPE